MPRKKSASPDDQLEALIIQYYTLDTQYKELENKRTVLNKTIKAAMRKRGISDFRSGSLAATYTLQSRIRYFDEPAVQKLKSLGFYQAIKEIVDAEAVKELIRAGQVNDDLLAEYSEIKEIEILSVKKAES